MQAIFRRLVTYLLGLYSTVFFILGFIILLTYLILFSDIRNQEGNARLLKMISDQAQLVENVNFLVSRKFYIKDQSQLNRINANIANDLKLLEQSHNALSTGVRFVREGQQLVGVSGQLSPKMREFYFDGNESLDFRMRSFLKAVQTISVIPESEMTADNPKLEHFFSSQSPGLLEKIHQAINLFQRKSEFMLVDTMFKLNVTLIVSLASLALVGLFMLHPLICRLKEDALRIKQKKAFADNIINTTQALIIGLDIEGKVILYNHHAQTNTGWSEEDVKHKDFFELFIPATEREAFQTLFFNTMTGSIKFADEIETGMQISTGDLINIVWNSTVIRDAGGGFPIMFLATGLDITARKDAEQKVLLANTRLEQLSRRLQSEVNLAATLQRSILPGTDIDLPGIQGKVNFLTSSEVGGDYYDYYKVGSHTSLLLIGDVSRRSDVAAIMVSAAKAGIYPLIHEGVTSPSEILNSLNVIMRATARQSLLMTMACFSLDARNGKLGFANAGHVLPFLLKHGTQQWEMLEACGLPLGMSVDSDYQETAIELTLEVGDCLFLYTDGLVEQESPDGEAFGYDRLEAILNANVNAKPQVLQNALMVALKNHCWGRAYTDDVTTVIITHSDRVIQTGAVNEDSDIIRISENFYRQGVHPIPRISKEYLVFVVEQGYADLLSRFSQDGICRILPKHNDFCKKLGWEHLLNQHHESPVEDLYALMPGQPQYRQFQITHTEDKPFIMEEIQSWLADQGNIPLDHMEALIVILDEMTENSLYGAPRDGKGVPYYVKGEERELSEHEEVQIDIAISSEVLGLMITDNWGTLTPGVFLMNLARAMEEGVEAGVGGVGLYMMWRLADYLQIRVHPQKHTQVTTLWDINGTVDMAVDSGVQFLYHSDYDYEAAYQNRVN